MTDTLQNTDMIRTAPLINASEINVNKVCSESRLEFEINQ